jgi:predicted permease
MTPLTRLRAILQRRRVARELDDELRFHVEMETQANLTRGLSPAEARRQAMASFGGTVQTSEAVRDVRAVPFESLWHDMRYAARTLGASPGFTLTAAGMLALGIGITSAMFTIVDALVLRPVPFSDAEQLAHLWMGTDRGGRTLVSPAVVDAWREIGVFEGVESATSRTVLVESGSVVVERALANVTPGVFDMLGGAQPVRGRLFDAGEGSPGQTDRVLIAESLWRSLYGADDGLIGRSIAVDDEQLTVVGILPDAFRFPSSETALWRPTHLRSDGELARAYVRFRADVTRDDAVRVATGAAQAADAANADLRIWIYPLVSGNDDYLEQAVPLLAGGVVLAFVVLCANVCGLLLARLTARRREFGMRAALGAGRGRLMRQAFVENALLGAMGVGLGVGLAWLLVAGARGILPQPLLTQTLNALDLDPRALVVTSLAGLAATLGAGLLPAWLGTRVDPNTSLQVVDRGATEARGVVAVSRGLLVVEVALACTLLVGATLLARSFVNLTRADRGIDTENVMTLWLNIRDAASDDTARTLLMQSLEGEFREIPDVREVAWSYGLPPGGGIISFGDWTSDRPGASPVYMEIDRYMISPEFFSLYRIPLIRGRAFTPSDPGTNVIVSERLAETLWGSVSPLGRTFRFEEETFLVVGLTGDIRYPSIDADLDRPEFYHAYTPEGTPMVSLRCGAVCPDSATIRHRLAATHPDVAVQDAGPADRRYAAELARPRAAAGLAAAFAIVALTAAAGGLFSVLSYTVGRRRREFGIRAAMGASPAQIQRQVFRLGLAVTVVGLAAGSLLAMLLTRSLATLQYGVTTSDPASLGIVVGIIAVTTLAAVWRPARLAARVDPMLLLRED